MPALACPEPSRRQARRCGLALARTVAMPESQSRSLDGIPPTHSPSQLAAVHRRLGRSTNSLDTRVRRSLQMNLITRTNTLAATIFPPLDGAKVRQMAAACG